MVSIQKLAARLGVSTATVSRALTPEHAHKVRPETRKRILELCNEERYRPNITGRSFVTGRTYKIGIILGAIEKDIGSPFFGLFMRSFCRTIQQRGYTATILYAGHDDKKSNNVIEFLQSSIADGYFLGTTMLDTAIKDSIRKSQCPVITLNQTNREVNDICSICRNLVPAYREAWSLLKKSERQNTVFLCNADDVKKFEVLQLTAPTDAKIDKILLEKNISYRGLNNLEELNRHTDDLLKYSVIWCESDMIAFSIYNILKSREIPADKIPKILGFDNAEGTLDNFHAPILSTVDPCWDKLGCAAAERLLRQLDGKSEQPQTDIEAKLVLRDTF